jgi:hypothetical protein
MAQICKKLNNTYASLYKFAGHLVESTRTPLTETSRVETKGEKRSWLQAEQKV